MIYHIQHENIAGSGHGHDGRALGLPLSPLDQVSRRLEYSTYGMPVSNGNRVMQ